MVKILLLVSLYLVSHSVSASCQGDDPLLHVENSVRCSGGAVEESVYFTHKGTGSAEYYISGQVTQCGNTPQYTWEEIDQAGNVIAFNNAEDRIVIAKNKTYRMKVTIDEPNCPNYMVSFYLERL